jgi:hypothetical protein
MLFLKTYQALGDIEAGRTATEVIVAFVALLIAAGCLPEKPPVVVAAGDTATCSGTDDEATAKLVGGIEGTVLTLGDEVYPETGRPRTSRSVTSPPGDRSRDAPSPLQATTSTTRKGPKGNSTTSVRLREIPMRATVC